MRFYTSLKQNNSVLLFLIIFLVWISLFLLRFIAPSDLLGRDQERPAAYMLDAVLNNHWIVQVDDTGDVCSKPPVYTWMGAGLVLIFGRMNDFTLYFPSALGVFGCCVLIWIFGKRCFGETCAFIAALALILSSSGIRILYLARTDALFSFATFFTACLGYRCWQRGGGWIWFWLAAAIATLTKGPLGLILAAGGLLALFWEKRRDDPRTGLRGNHTVGLILYIVISGGWLYLAYLDLGYSVIEKIIGNQLLGKTNWASGRYTPGFFFFLIPSLYFISRFLPWSLFTLAGLWRIWKHPADIAEERRFERFLATYLCFGITLFSLFPHQRPDHLFPLFPAAALLAGREVALWMSKRSWIRYLVPISLGIWIFALTGFSVYYFKLDPAQNEIFAETKHVRELATRFEARFGRKQPLVYVDVPFGIQYYLNTMKRRVSYEEAANMMKRSGGVMAAVRNPGRLQQLLPPGRRLHIIMQTHETAGNYTYIVSNRHVR